MRAFGLAAVALLLVQSAQAQDVLRGSVVESGPPVMRWSGIYGGAQIGYASAHMDFSGATDPLVAYSLRNSELGGTDVPTWDIIGKINKSGATFGGFVGFNSQWDDIILGLEVNYNRTAIAGTSSGTLSRGVTAGSDLYHTTSEGNGSLSISDYATVRARVGQLYGNVMPYVFGGLGLGRGKIDINSSVYGTIERDPNPDDPFGPFTGADNRTVYMFGYTVGGGVEMAVMPNVFVRAEYEFIQFGSFAGMSTALHSARFGGGLKF